MFYFQISKHKIMNTRHIIYLLLTYVSLTQSAYCNGSPCHHHPCSQNNNSIDITIPQFIRKVSNTSGGNASLYHVGTGDDAFSVVHLWGTPYQKGYAHGTLMKQHTTEFVQRAFAYFVSEFDQAVNKSVPWIPPKMAEWVAKVGLEVALDVTADITKPFTGTYFLEEMQGMADATGLDYKMIRRVHMIGELTKGSCSMYGAWSNATADGGSLQMRALDWDTSGPFQDYPQVTVYHKESTGPSESSEFNVESNVESTSEATHLASTRDTSSTPNANSLDISFANVGWTGWIGSITGTFKIQKLKFSKLCTNTSYNYRQIYFYSFISLLICSLQSQLQN